ncbi:hypothetical protein ACJIZ3_007890 [Penstemon smallii]|uniref:PB1 domain-containing protein n=1 Tax=Penstemon smallii TaxID=265156 RepID=A0ABD3T883_9LAMI
MDNPPPPRDQNHPPMDNPPLDQIHPPPCDPNINEIHEIIDLNDDLMREILADSLDANHEITSLEHQLSGPSDTFFPNINPYVASTSRDPTSLQFPNINPVVPHGRSDAFIPTGNEVCEDQSNTRVENWVLSNDIRAEDQNNTRGKEQALTIDDLDKSFKATIEVLACLQRSPKQLANLLNISVSSLEELRKGFDLTFPLSNKKAKHSTPSTSSASSVASVSAAVNLPSSLDMGHIFNFQVLGIYDKDNIKAMELKDLDLDDDSILVRVNFQPPGCSWLVIRFKIRKNASFDELIGILNKKLRPVPQNMVIFYEDTFGMFCTLADEEDMSICLRICHGQKFVNLVIKTIVF